MTMPVYLKSNDEDINALAETYETLMQRLDSAQKKEKQMSVMQLQAQFDMLQAQINPHFMYNVLNTISSRGFYDNDEVICEICGHLSSMLRYSTNNESRTVKLAEEIEYAKDFIYLLKARFGERLQVNLSIEKDMYEIQVPKVLLQQFVENAVSHGFDDHVVLMQIDVLGRRTETGWEIHVLDNGSGISDEKREKVMGDIQMLKYRINTQENSLEFKIGGMGIANTYGRMYLMYGNRTIFELHNRTETHGMEVLIGVKNAEVLGIHS
jgi:two-component system sensor histidine kinase YesM